MTIIKAFLRFGAFVFWAGTASLLLAQCNQPQPASAARPTGGDSGRKAAPAAEEVAALHREWILKGWEWQAGNGPFNFQNKLGNYYDWTIGGVLLYDDFDPQHRLVRSAAEYGAIWEPNFSALRTARHRVTLEPTVLVSGDLATSTLQFAARLERQDGQVTGIRTLSSLVWRATDKGWKIVREHNSSVVVPAGQVEALLRAPAGP